MDLVREIMPLIIKGEKIRALWVINQAQVNLQEEKKAAEKAIQMLDLKEISEFASERNKKTVYTIGEVAKHANVSTSSIRHWEKEQLIEPNRDKESGFRIFNLSDLRKVLIIRTIQRSVYSLDIVREVLSEIDKDNLVQARKIAQQSIQYIDHTLVEQINGIASLHNLLETVSVSD